MAVLFGTLGNDTLTGTIDPDIINGLAGNDRLNGLEADDQLFGGQGNDTVYGGQGRDLAQGGQESDRIFGNADNDTIFGDLGDDTGFGGDGDDLLYGDQSAAANFGGDGNDVLFGEAGNDTLFGLDGFDRLSGDGGEDLIDGGEGNDTVSGGEGNDNLQGGEDNDLVTGEQGNDSLLGNAGNDTVYGGAEGDILFGNRGDDLLNGNSSDDEVNGNQGNDTVYGGQGNDLVRGGADNDLVLGGQGNDLLHGDRGIDTLTGGEGNDVFFLLKGLGGTTLAEADNITDFVNGVDKIGLIASLKFEDLNIFQGTGENAADTIIQDDLNDQFLIVLKGVDRTGINQADFAIPGVLAFSANRFRVNEDGTPVVAVTVIRTAGSDGAVSVTVTPSNGSAGTPEDYNNTPVVVSFASGETSKTVTIPIVDDALVEPIETINLTLSNPTGGASIGSQNTALVEVVDGDSQFPRQTLINPIPGFFDRFGTTVAAVGNNVLIGAPGDDIGENQDTGSAYLFDGNTGALLSTITNPTPGSFDRFGAKVAAVGNNVLIGTPEDDNSGAVDVGVAYLFNNTGALLQTFRNPTPAAFDLFGASVAAVGNNVLIGTPNDSTGTFQTGTAYLFDGNTGQLLRTFSNPTPEVGDNFGTAIAAVGNNILISAPGDDTVGLNAGAVYLFDGVTGTLLKTFFNPNPDAEDGFGNSVAGEGNNIVVGAPFDDAGAFNAGVAYLFDSNSGALLQTFRNPTPDFNENFATSVAAVAGRVLIGSPYDNRDNFRSGSAYLFDSATGGLLKTLINPSPSYDDNFGTSVAVLGNSFLVGTPGDDRGSYQSGTAYLF